ncbi:MAG TPA: hypothetical protein DD640_04085 [Clostridiales bacterium]|nr:hypothetical protein [Clostridiales bacterium]
MTETYQAKKPAAPPEVLLFDLGNILVRLNFADCFWPGRTLELGELPYAERWAGSRAVYAYETGQMASLDEFFQAARSEMGFSVTLEEFGPLFQQIIGDLFPETAPLLSALQAAYPLMLLSNTNQEHWIYCRDVLNLKGFFQEEFLSFQMGLMKPDPRIFQRALARIRHDPENIWYFDDREENVLAAQKHGICAFRSWGGQTLVRQLRELGLIE